VPEEREEVRRVLEAIKALAAIEDDTECVKAVTDLLGEWPKAHAQLRELRQERVQRLRSEQKLTWQEIATILGGVHPTRAQQIATGLRGTKRPPKKADPAE
jgi:hypothetical protein